MEPKTESGTSSKKSESGTSSKKSESGTSSKKSSKSSSSKSSSSKSSSSKSSSSTSPEEEDVDSLLDWWSDDVAGAGSSDAPEPARKSHSTHHRHASSRRRGSGNRTHKHKPSADDGDEDEERSSRSASSALDLALDAATDALEGAHESHSDDRRDDSDDNSRDVSSGSRASTPRDIEPSPVLDVEDEAAREEMAARAREVSEREARREKRDMARASHATDSEADAQAESRHRGGAGSIVLHTISPEEALKHVSRVHHREEVEAAEAAADLEAREREEREEEERARVADAAARGSDLMDAADDAYDDLVGSGVNDVANDIEEEMAEDDEDAWAAVGREEKEKTEEMAEEVGAEDGAAGREEKEKTGEDGAARAEDGSSAKSSSILLRVLLRVFLPIFLFLSVLFEGAPRASRADAEALAARDGRARETLGRGGFGDARRTRGRRSKRRPSRRRQIQSSRSERWSRRIGSSRGRASTRARIGARGGWRVAVRVHSPAVGTHVSLRQVEGVRGGRRRLGRGGGSFEERGVGGHAPDGERGRVKGWRGRVCRRRAPARDAGWCFKPCILDLLSRCPVKWPRNGPTIITKRSVRSVGAGGVAFENVRSVPLASQCPGTRRDGCAVGPTPPPRSRRTSARPPRLGTSRVPPVRRAFPGMTSSTSSVPRFSGPTRVRTRRFARCGPRRAVGSFPPRKSSSASSAW